MDEARVAQQAKRAALDRAVDLDADGWLTVAERDPIKLKRWLDAAGASKAWLVTAPMATLRSRARRRGPSCEALVDKWDGYEDDSDFTELTEQWSDDDMRTNIDAETQYPRGRARRSRCARMAATCSAAASPTTRSYEPRTVTRAPCPGSPCATATRRGCRGFRERIAKGALTLPTKGGEPHAAARAGPT